MIGYKANVLKSVAFLFISNNQFKKYNRKNLGVVIHTLNSSYLRSRDQEEFG
jgi:hypothetical protein